MKGLLWRSTGLVILGASAGRLVGVAREAVFASHFGASPTTDAYLVAVLIPTLLQNVVAGGTLQAAFVPLLAEEEAASGRAAANRLVADLNLVTFVILSTLTAGLVAFAGPVVRLVGPGFGRETVNMAASLLRWSAVLIVLNGALAVMLGALNTYGRYRTTATLSPVLNGVTIVAIVALAPLWGIYAAMAGLVFGTVAQCCMQLGPLRAEGVRLREGRFSLHLIHRLLPALVPAILASAVAQSNPLADKVIGSFLGVGSITYLNYSELFAGGVAIVTTSVALVAFPMISGAVARREDQQASRMIDEATHFTLLTAIPLAALLGAFAPDVVRSVYGWGKLSADDLHQVALCLAGYAIGIPFTGLFYLLIRVLYSLKRAPQALYLSTAYFVMHTVLALVLAPWLGAPGIALATSVSGVATGLGGWCVGRNGLLRKTGLACVRLSSRLIAAALLSVLPAVWVLRPWSHQGSASAVHGVWRAGIATVTVATLFLIVVRVVSPESREIVARGWKHFRFRLGFESRSTTL